MKTCQHPLNDQVVLVRSMVLRDLMEGQVTTRTGYFCAEHQQFGEWVVEKRMPRMDLKPLGCGYLEEGGAAHGL